MFVDYYIYRYNPDRDYQGFINFYNPERFDVNDFYKEIIGSDEDKNLCTSSESLWIIPGTLDLSE